MQASVFVVNGYIWGCMIHSAESYYVWYITFAYHCTWTDAHLIWCC